MWETWLPTTTHPPVAGIFSPSIQRCLVNNHNKGSRMATQKPNAQPRGS